MLASVSGWSGPSLAFRSASVSSWSFSASACRPRSVVAGGQVVHALERVGVVGAQLGLAQRQRLLVELERPRWAGPGVVAAGQVVHARERVGVVGSAVPCVAAAGRLVLLPPPSCRIAQIVVGLARASAAARPRLAAGRRSPGPSFAGRAASMAWRSVTSGPRPPAGPPAVPPRAPGPRKKPSSPSASVAERGLDLRLLGLRLIGPSLLRRLGALVPGLRGQDACQVLTAPPAQQARERPRRRQRRAVLAGELPQPVRRRRRAGLDRVVRQVALDVAGEAAGRLVPPRPVLLQRLHHDPVQLAAHQLRQPRRLGLAPAPRSSAAHRCDSRRAACWASAAPPRGSAAGSRRRRPRRSLAVSSGVVPVSSS